jgi:RNA polymerase sigma-70 factor (ECF subfamily)
MARARARQAAISPDLSRYRPALVRYFRKRAHPADVEDLVQDVFLNMQTRQAETPIGNVEGYLFAVAMSTLVRKSQQEKPRRAHTPFEDDDDAALPPEEISPERILLGKERLALAVRVMKNLPPRTQEVFLLHRFEEMTYPAIGAALGMSVSAVEKHIMIALKRLVADLGAAR